MAPPPQPTFAHQPAPTAAFPTAPPPLPGKPTRRSWVVDVLPAYSLTFGALLAVAVTVGALGAVSGEPSRADQWEELAEGDEWLNTPGPANDSTIEPTGSFDSPRAADVTYGSWVSSVEGVAPTTWTGSRFDMPNSTIEVLYLDSPVTVDQSLATFLVAEVLRSEEDPLRTYTLTTFEPVTAGAIGDFAFEASPSDPTLLRQVSGVVIVVDERVHVVTSNHSSDYHQPAWAEYQQFLNDLAVR